MKTHWIESLNQNITSTFKEFPKVQSIFKNAFYRNKLKSTETVNRSILKQSYVWAFYEKSTFSCTIRFWSNVYNRTKGVKKILRNERIYWNQAYELIQRRSCHHIEISQLIRRANLLTDFYIIAILLFNELISSYCLSRGIFGILPNIYEVNTFLRIC